ncbi:cupin domain-containing protein [uncultured Clostridium sp.]|uniref:cupin domain-containing protein n=1 Tax=uncultured Clostridium sp. TaxID=59620 RepID=UPI0028EB5AEE|nr:cupin domain-containing protein [uncultured Clostridium sp.]
MYNMYKTYPCPYFTNTSMYRLDNTYDDYEGYACPYCMYGPEFSDQFAYRYTPFIDEDEENIDCDSLRASENNSLIHLKDYGPEPFVVNISEATKENNNFRTALWTGKHLQLTLMSIKPGEDVGLEIHPDTDQFLRVEEGQGIVKMGDTKCNLNFQKNVCDDFAILIPAGKWHNIINTGNKPLKLYSIYAPPHHPHGTVHKTKADAEAAE